MKGQLKWEIPSSNTCWGMLSLSTFFGTGLTDHVEYFDGSILPETLRFDIGSKALYTNWRYLMKLAKCFWRVLFDNSHSEKLNYIIHRIVRNQVSKSRFMFQSFAVFLLCSQFARLFHWYGTFSRLDQIQYSNISSEYVPSSMYWPRPLI